MIPHRPTRTRSGRTARVADARRLRADRPPADARRAPIHGLNLRHVADVSDGTVVEDQRGRPDENRRPPRRRSERGHSREWEQDDSAGRILQGRRLRFRSEDRARGGAAGVGDAGLVLATLDPVADGDPQGWFDAWSGTAHTLADQGDAAVAAGHHRSAGWAYLAAAEYFAKALSAVDGLADRSFCCRPSSSTGAVGRV